MKCLYYLAPTLARTRTISDDLHEIGIKDWFIHVISNDEAGLKRERIHSSNYIETLDFVRTGLLGAIVGFFVGMFAIFLIMASGIFGSNASIVAYLPVILLTTLFGGWIGGLLGAGMENKKLSHFHQEIVDGQYLFLIYARKGEAESIHAMMRDRHPESEHAATDEHFLAPFGELVRRNHAASH